MLTKTTKTPTQFSNESTARLRKHMLRRPTLTFDSNNNLYPPHRATSSSSSSAFYAQSSSSSSSASSSTNTNNNDRMRCSKTITTTRDKQRQTRREGVKTEAIFQSFFNGNKTRKDKNDTTKNTDGDPLKAPMQNGAPATLINPVINQKEKERPIVNPEDFTLKPGEVSKFVAPATTAEDLQLAGWYLKAILTADVYDVAIESPLELAARLSEKITANAPKTPGGDAQKQKRIFLKREDLQPVFSFKIRGAYNKIKNLKKEELVRGIITASAGNHAQGVALSAKTLGIKAVVAMPVTTPKIKVEAVRRLGGEVVLIGENFDETAAYAKKRSVDDSMTFIPPFDEPYVIAGQGTCGVEILRQLPTVKAVFIPIGGGGLIAGVATYLKTISPKIKIIGVEPTGANAMAQSLDRGEIIRLSKVDGFADGVAVKEVGVNCFQICQQSVDGVMMVRTDQTCAALKDVFEDTRSILEPSGALAVAGAKEWLNANPDFEGDVVCITSGANMNFDRLRVISEIADGGSGSEATLISAIPEENGSFKRFVSLVGEDTNFTEFKYRINNSDGKKKKLAKVLYSVNVESDAQLQSCIARLRANGIPTEDFTKDETTQTHLRNITGGASNIPNERLYNVLIPERVGALGKFLDFVSPKWNVSMTHYRAGGQREATVLVGIQVPDEELKDLESALDGCGYEYSYLKNNRAYNMLFDEE
jgi:threonine dehydratase